MLFMYVLYMCIYVYVTHTHICMLFFFQCELLQTEVTELREEKEKNQNEDVVALKKRKDELDDEVKYLKQSFNEVWY